MQSEASVFALDVGLAYEIPMLALADPLAIRSPAVAAISEARTIRSTRPSMSRVGLPRAPASNG